MVKTGIILGDIEMRQQCEIIINGHLPPQWMVAFEGMDVIYLPDGSSTCITGSLPDQSALYGLLMRLRDLGINLVSVKAIDLKDKHE
jgi:hypothetical protein